MTDAPHRYTAPPPKVCKTRYTGEPEDTVHAEHDPHLAYLAGPPVEVSTTAPADATTLPKRGKKNPEPKE